MNGIYWFIIIVLFILSIGIGCLFNKPKGKGGSNGDK